jgi:hypothetical protein
MAYDLVRIFERGGFFFFSGHTVPTPNRPILLRQLSKKMKKITVGLHNDGNNVEIIRSRFARPVSSTRGAVRGRGDSTHHTCVLGFSASPRTDVPGVSVRNVTSPPQPLLKPIRSEAQEPRVTHTRNPRKRRRPTRARKLLRRNETQ